jgi:ATP-dependent DNA helicase HFM1/MER3
MDSSYEPLILKKMKTSRDQFGAEQSSLHVGDVTPVDSGPAEPGVSPTNTAEKCRRILNRTSEKSCMLFAGKRDSPLEKSKLLIKAPLENSLQLAAKRDSPSEKSKMPTTLDECSLVLAGGKDSPLEKSSILIRTPVENPFKKGTPVENSPQFTAKRDSPAEKRKFCFSSPPLPCFQAAKLTKQVQAAGQLFNIEEYVKDILEKRKGSESGDSFLNCRSVFSFL